MKKKTLNGIIEPDDLFVLRHQSMLSVNLSPGEIGDESSVCDATVHVLRKSLGRKSGGVNLYQIGRGTIQRVTITLGSDKAALEFGFVVGGEKHRDGRTIEVECSLDLHSELSMLVEQRKKCAETIPDPGDADLLLSKGKCLGVRLLLQGCEALLKHGFERPAVKIVH